MNFSRRYSDADSAGATIDVLGPNALTAAGVIGAGATAVASTMLLSTAMPVQVIGSATIAAGFYGAGKLQEAGKLPSMPSFGKDDKSDAKKSDASEEAAPAAA